MDAGTLPLSITPRAAAKIAEILKAEGEGLMLRVAVSGGGCSGFSYAFSFDDAKTGDDLVLREGAATVVVDNVSLDYLKGSVIDWKDGLIGSSFHIENPNATSSCGCGTSFSV